MVREKDVDESEGADVETDGRTDEAGLDFALLS